MAAPVDRGQTTPVAGLVATSPAGTAIGDLVIAITVTSTTASGIPAHTLQTGFTEIGSQSLDDGVNDSRLSVAYKVATAAGAQTYQPYTASTGTSSTGLHVLQSPTFDVSTLPPIVFATLTTNGVPNPPVTAALTGDYKFLAIGAWNFSAATASTPTVMANYGALVHLAASAINDLAWATRDRTGLAGATEDPAAFGDNSTPTGSISATLAIKGLDPRTGTGSTTASSQISVAAGAGAIAGTGTTASAAQLAEGPGTNAITGAGTSSSSSQIAEDAGTVEEPSITGTGVTAAAAQLAVGAGTTAIAAAGTSASSAQSTVAAANSAIAGEALTHAAAQLAEGMAAAAVAGVASTLAAVQASAIEGAVAIVGEAASSAGAQVASGTGTTEAADEIIGAGETLVTAQTSSGAGTVAIAAAGESLAASQVSAGDDNVDVDGQATAMIAVDAAAHVTNVVAGDDDACVIAMISGATCSATASPRTTATITED